MNLLKQLIFIKIEKYLKASPEAILIRETRRRKNEKYNYNGDFNVVSVHRLVLWKSDL